MPAYDATISAIYGNSESEVSYYVTEINNLEEFKLFRDSVNNGVTYEGVSVKLNSDIDLNDEKTWTPIGSGTRSGAAYETSSHPFKGIFDGNNKTISNLNVTQDSSSKAATIGLFGIVEGGTIKNIKMEKVNISDKVSENVGAIVGILIGNGTIDNAIVQSGSIYGAEAVGGIVGRITIQGTASNCKNYASVSAKEATSSSKAGGIVGTAYYQGSGKKMNIIDCTNGGNVTAYSAGGIVGYNFSNVTRCKNLSSATIRGTGLAVGGIVAEQQMCGKISDCTNEGTVTGTKENTGESGQSIKNNATIAGGIIGWVRYSENTTNYPYNEIIEVCNNTNIGKITGVRAAGGIIGDVYNAVNCHDNTNKDCTITATTFACGITTIQQDTGIYYEEYKFTFKNNTSSNTTLSGSCQKEKIWNNFSGIVDDKDLN